MHPSLDARGHLGLTHRDSQPVYPPPEHPTGPNIVVVLFDDLGFADLGCYGAEVRTPRLDGLAEKGHRYNNFHTTTLCSPSRACLLTGRNHHSVGMRMLSNVDSGWPSGRGRITRRAALVSEVLHEAGYNTFAVGKWHVAPMRETSPAGPFDEWPLGRGFNQFYGFMNGATDHFYPELVRDNHSVPPPATPEEGYHLTADLIDRSIGYIADHIAHAPFSPFFLYLPLGAAHAPHHAPAEFMEAVRGRYDQGWDVIRRQRYERQLAMGVIPPGTELPPSNPDVPPWDSLRPDEQRVAGPSPRGLRRLRRTHGPAARSPRRLPRTQRTARRHRRDRYLGQRRGYGRRPARRPISNSFLQRHRRGLRPGARRPRRGGRPPRRQPLRHRLGPSLEHPVAVVQVPHPRRRHSGSP